LLFGFSLFLLPRFGNGALPGLSLRLHARLLGLAGAFEVLFPQSAEFVEDLVHLLVGRSKCLQQRDRRGRLVREPTSCLGNDGVHPTIVFGVASLLGEQAIRLMAERFGIRVAGVGPNRIERGSDGSDRIAALKGRAPALEGRTRFLGMLRLLDRLAEGAGIVAGGVK
jgi:hypothetical protein